mgnify:CR=1 FL=1
MGTLKEIIDNSRYAVFFGGAGVSTASNIPDFRGANGIYNTENEWGLPPERIISHSFFVRRTKDFYDYYKKYMVYPDARPNEVHTALARLEKEGKIKAVLTQNIDGLHQKAGSKNVLELHGSVHRNYCEHCGKAFPLSYILQSTGVPRCDACGGPVRPDVVLYEEALDGDILEAAVEDIAAADLLIIGGTSLVVYPAAGLIRYFQGSHLVLVNKTATAADSRADLVIHDAIGAVFAQLP